MKRSNRLVMLIGVFLAIVAFVGILVLSTSTNKDKTPPVVTTGPVVVATVDIPLSTRIRADQVNTTTVNLTSITPGAFTDVSQVVGQIVREPVFSGAQITAKTFGLGNGEITTITTPAGQRAIAVQVDQLTGVGAVIKSGDYVDMILGLQGDQFPVISINPTDKSVTVVTGLNGTSVKVLLQGMQVLGTLLPPVAADTSGTGGGGATPSASPGTGGTTTPGTALSGTQEIVILSATAQQAEVIRFAQLSGAAPLGGISLVLRSPDDFIDPATGQPLPPVTIATTGIILKTLVDSYGVLPPELVETITPRASSKP